MVVFYLTKFIGQRAPPTMMSLKGISPTSKEIFNTIIVFDGYKNTVENTKAAEQKRRYE